MGEIIRVITRIFSVVLLVFLLSCSSQEDIPVADFSVSRIEGEYSANLNIEYAGPRPSVSVFNGYLTVSMTGSDNFTMVIDFPGDYITEEFNGTVKEKIVSKTNSAIGGVYFEIGETSVFKGDPSLPLSIKMRNGEIISVYAYFIEKAGGEVELNLQLVDKNPSPTIFEFKATK